MGIPVEYRYILERTSALAHLPAEKIPEGFGHITDLIDNVERLNEPAAPKLLAFGSYVRRTWVPLAKIISCNNKPCKTNNTCENFHMRIFKLLGTHPSFWKMIRKKTTLEIH